MMVLFYEKNSRVASGGLKTLGLMTTVKDSGVRGPLFSTQTTAEFPSTTVMLMFTISTVHTKMREMKFS